MHQLFAVFVDGVPVVRLRRKRIGDAMYKCCGRNDNGLHGGASKPSIGILATCDERARFGTRFERTRGLRSTGGRRCTTDQERHGSFIIKNMVTFILPQRRNAFITVHIFEHGRLVHGMYKIHTLVPVQKQGPADMAMARLCTNTRNFKNTMIFFHSFIQLPVPGLFEIQLNNINECAEAF